MKEKNIILENKAILVTGAIGFIGTNLVMELFRQVNPVYIIGIDCFFARPFCIKLQKLFVGRCSCIL